MSTIEPKVATRRGVRWGYVVIVPVVLFCLWSIVGVIGFFHLSSDAAALRQSFVTCAGGSWENKITINAGFLTTGFIRVCSKPVKLNREPRAALQSLRAAEVGVYTLCDHAAPFNHGLILARADKVMSARGWERIVGVSNDGKLVAVFTPRRSGSAGTLKVCILVSDGPNLVVASG